MLKTSFFINSSVLSVILKSAMLESEGKEHTFLLGLYSISTSFLPCLVLFLVTQLATSRSFLLCFLTNKQSYYTSMSYSSGSQSWFLGPLGDREEVPRGTRRDHLVEAIVLMLMQVLATISVILIFFFLCFLRLCKKIYKCLDVFLFYLGRLM